VHGRGQSGRREGQGGKKVKAPRGRKPGPDRGTGSLQSNQAERQNEVRNYEISKVNKRIKNPVGMLKKISAAVIVDGATKEAVDAGEEEPGIQARSSEEMQRIEAIVKKAIDTTKAGRPGEVINMPSAGPSPKKRPGRGTKAGKNMFSSPTNRSSA
jgi:flagellar M-ring protein FliF